MTFRFASASTTAAVINSDLTMDDLRKMIHKIFPVLYYAESESVEIGKLYRVKEVEYFPEFIVYNPVDRDMVRSLFKRLRTLVDIKDEPESDRRERILRKLNDYVQGLAQDPEVDVLS